jgi:hypothetical protein
MPAISPGDVPAAEVGSTPVSGAPVGTAPTCGGLVGAALGALLGPVPVPEEPPGAEVAGAGLGVAGPPPLPAEYEGAAVADGTGAALDAAIAGAAPNSTAPNARVPTANACVRMEDPLSAARPVAGDALCTRSARETARPGGRL